MCAFDFNNPPIPSDKFKCGKKIDFNSVIKSFNQSPTFGFDYLKDDSSIYSFNSPDIGVDDYKIFLERLKLISRFNFDYLFETAPYDFHFRQLRYPFPVKLKALVEESFNVVLSPENTPIVFEMALYTDQRGASRLTGIKSPRIFFSIPDIYGVIYILYFDAFHEIFPGK